MAQSEPSGLRRGGTIPLPNCLCKFLMKALELPVLRGFWWLADVIRLLSILGIEQQIQGFLLLHV